jgi:hypothetical protein
VTPQFTELKVDPSYQSNFPFFFFCLSLPIAIRGIPALFPTTFGYNQWRTLKPLLSTVTKRNGEDKTLYLLITRHWL